MNRQRIFTIIFVSIIAMAITASSSWAGSRDRHRLEGFAIGVGALLLTKAIIDHHYHDTATVTPAARYNRHRHRPAGHWEIQEEWVPAKYKKVWNPGHYNRRGHWIRGKWIRIQDKPGHWSKRKVWVPYSYD